MPDLFDKPSVRIERIDESHARRSGDSLGILVGRLRRHQEFYPEIETWIRDRVIPGLKTGERIAYLGYREEKPILAAVLKQGESTKFCHLSIEDGFRGDHLGQLMFSLMASEVRHIAAEIHFTLPEGLWEAEHGFFRSFGFEAARPSPIQYRLFEEELRCSAPFSTVWNHVVAKLPTLLTSTAIAGYDLNEGVVLSVRDDLARAIMRGEKTVEVRRRFSERWAGRKASVYASGASQTLLGMVSISDVLRAGPDEIWERFGEEIGSGREEYSAYTDGCDSVFALRLTDPIEYAAPVPISQLSHLIGDVLHPPQSYSRFSRDDKWGQAISIAALLHGRWSGRVSALRSDGGRARRC